MRSKLDGFRMARGVRLVFYAFDLLHLDGRDTAGLPGRIERGQAKLLTRTGLDWSAKYPGLLTVGRPLATPCV
jgi:ATP-dependent DNA ligase